MIPTLKTVLVATDLSDFSNAAVPYAFTITAPEGTVTLLHVIEPAAIPSPLYAHYSPGKTPTPEEQAEQHAAIEKELRGLAPAEAAERGIEVRVAVREHSLVSEAVIEVADQIDADMIVMASHGRSGVMKALLGSSAEAVLRKTNRPILVVRPNSE